MEGRIAQICSALPPARVFADIGCDHGYMTEYMLERRLCERAYISDVSAKSLKKAERLLARYIAEGSCIPVVADGMRGLPEPADLVLIAGLGGEEIVKILQDADLPARFLFQPMKNSDKVRRYLVERGARIGRDDTFSDGGYYYDLILGNATGGDSYSEREFRFGRDNLKGSSRSFLFQMREELNKTNSRLQAARTGESKNILTARKAELEEIIHEVERYF